MTLRFVPTPEDTIAAYFAPITKRINDATKSHQARAALRQAKIDAMHRMLAKRK